MKSSSCGSRARAVARRLAVATVPALVFLACDVRAQSSPFTEELLSPVEAEARQLEIRKAAAPVLRATPRRLSAASKSGETVSVELTLANAGGSVLRWSVSQAPPWAKLDIRNGELKFEESRKLAIPLDPAGLDSGLAEGVIEVSASGAEGSPARIAVSLRVPAREDEPYEPRRPFAARMPIDGVPVPEEDAPVTGPIRPQQTDGDGVRQRALWIRAGYFQPSSGEVRDANEDAMVGIAVRMPRHRRSVSYELGVDVAQASTSSGSYSSRLVAAGVDLLYFPGGKGGFLVSGLAECVEFTTRESSGEEFTNYVPTFSLGAGYCFSERVDLRAEYALVIDSENVPGMASVALGVAF